MSQNSRNQGFSNYICLIIEGSGSGSRTGSGSGSIFLTNGSGSERPKNTWIRKPWENVVFACRLLRIITAQLSPWWWRKSWWWWSGGECSDRCRTSSPRWTCSSWSFTTSLIKSLHFSTLAKERVSRDCLIQIFFLTCFPLDTRLKHFFIEIFYRCGEIFGVKDTGGDELNIWVQNFFYCMDVTN